MGVMHGSAGWTARFNLKIVWVTERPGDDQSWFTSCKVAKVTISVIGQNYDSNNL